MDGNGKKLLLVEDETLLRMIGADALSEAGYEVLEAESADEALRILKSVDEIEILFTDVRMPGSMDGLELAELVHARWPAVKILVTSGHARPVAQDLPDSGRFLPKPYNLHKLKAEVDTLFGD